MTELFTTSQIEASEDNLPKEIEVLQEGAWKDMPGRPDFEITASDIEEYATNFNKGVRPGVAINIEHDRDPHFGKQAAGWISGAIARVKENGKKALFVTPDFNKMGGELVGDKRFRFVSAEFVPRSLGGQRDAEGKGTLSNVLKKVSLTNEPLMKDLPAIMASEAGAENISVLTVQLATDSIKNNQGDQQVNLEALRGKQKTEVSAGELTFLESHKSELSTAEVTKFFGEVAASEDTVTIKASELSAKDTKIAELQAQVKASEGTEARITELEKAANLGVKASEELAKTKATAIVDEHIKRGAIKSDSRDFWSGQLIKASEEDATALEAQLKELPSSALLGDAKGDKKNGEAGGGALKQLNEKAEELIKASEGKLDYTKALLQARAENTVLASEADAEAANGEIA